MMTADDDDADDVQWVLGGMAIVVVAAYSFYMEYDCY
jgi:hypothetical protein